MKKILTSSICAAALGLAAPAFAGEGTVHYSSKNYTQGAVSQEVYGTGFYGAIQAGINAHQEYRGSNSEVIDGIRFSFDAESNVGGIAGAKLGYVFGTGTIRPTVDLDAFYNGFKTEGELRGGGRGANFESDIHSGAFLANFLVRFDLGRFQPYVGAGAGVYVAKVDNAEVGGRELDLGDDDSSDGFAWQLVAGSDYYFTNRMSAFLEYKYLNYEGDTNIRGEDRIDQHIVALGLRLHF